MKLCQKGARTWFKLGVFRDQGVVMAGEQQGTRTSNEQLHPITFGLIHSHMWPKWSGLDKLKLHKNDYLILFIVHRTGTEFHFTTYWICWHLHHNTFWWMVLSHTSPQLPTWCFIEAPGNCNSEIDMWQSISSQLLELGTSEATSSKLVAASSITAQFEAYGFKWMHHQVVIPTVSYSQWVSQVSSILRFQLVDWGPTLALWGAKEMAVWWESWPNSRMTTMSLRWYQ